MVRGVVVGAESGGVRKSLLPLWLGQTDMVGMQRVVNAGAPGRFESDPESRWDGVDVRDQSSMHRRTQLFFEFGPSILSHYGRLVTHSHNSSIITFHFRMASHDHIEVIVPNDNERKTP